jgi:hypothetical protein
MPAWSDHLCLCHLGEPLLGSWRFSFFLSHQPRNWDVSPSTPCGHAPKYTVPCRSKRTSTVSTLLQQSSKNVSTRHLSVSICLIIEFFAPHTFRGCAILRGRLPLASREAPSCSGAHVPSVFEFLRKHHSHAHKPLVLSTLLTHRVENLWWLAIVLWVTKNEAGDAQ